MPAIIKLKDSTPLAKGKSRLVFQHPDHSSQLIKVINAEVVDDRFGSGTKWYKKRRRYGKFLSYLREIQEFLAIYSTEDCALPFLQEVIGFAKTDLGLGLVVTAIHGKNGNLAPTLAYLISRHLYDETAKQALAVCLDQILYCNVIISDLNLGNLVYSYNQELGYHFVLIDGLGNNNPLPFKAISKRLNHRSKLGRFARLYARIERAQNKYTTPLAP